MKKFEGSIQVEVAIDAIAKKFHGTFPDDYPHSELLTEIVVEGLKYNGNLSLADLWNGMHGVVKEINFQPGQVLMIPFRMSHDGWLHYTADGLSLHAHEGSKTGRLAVVVSVDRYALAPINVVTFHVYENNFKLKVVRVQTESLFLSDLQNTTDMKVQGDMNVEERVAEMQRVMQEMCDVENTARNINSKKP